MQCLCAKFGFDVAGGFRNRGENILSFPFISILCLFINMKERVRDTTSGFYNHTRPSFVSVTSAAPDTRRFTLALCSESQADVASSPFLVMERI